jgi:hypothetical protein
MKVAYDTAQSSLSVTTRESIQTLFTTKRCEVVGCNSEATEESPFMVYHGVELPYALPGGSTPKHHRNSVLKTDFTEQVKNTR